MLDDKVTQRKKQIKTKQKTNKTEQNKPNQ